MIHIYISYSHIPYKAPVKICYIFEGSVDIGADFPHLSWGGLRTPDPWTAFLKGGLRPGVYIGVPQIRGTLLGVPVVRIIVCVGVYIGVPLLWETTTYRFRPRSFASRSRRIPSSRFPKTG